MNDTVTIEHTTHAEGPHKTSASTTVNRLRWPIRFLLDNNGNPSATKIFAYGVLLSNYQGHPMDPWTVGLLEAALFGYSMFKGYTDKTELKASAAGAVSLAASFTKSKIEELRKTFTYTNDGVPAKSLPAQPDARTPAGDE